MSNLSINAIYQHYKGDYYFTVLLSKRESDGVDLVSYRNVKTNETWTRPVSEFLELVPANMLHEALGQGDRKIARFSLVVTNVKEVEHNKANNVISCKMADQGKGVIHRIKCD